MVARRKVVDRERLELDYRAGLHTFRQMAETHGISGPRIKQIADEEGWERDLGAKMRQAAAAQDKSEWCDSGCCSRKPGPGFCQNWIED